MTNTPMDEVSEILLKQKFSIVELTADPVTNDTIMTIIHDLHPEDEVTVKIISKEQDGEDSMELKFEGPDNYTDAEATLVLHDVQDVMIAIIQKAVEGDDLKILDEGDEPVGLVEPDNMEEGE